MYKDDILTVPDYFILNAGLTKTFGGFEIFARVENLLDASYVTEPGFPMASRQFRIALTAEGFAGLNRKEDAQ